MKTCLIKQPAGLGDILFTLKIAKKVIETNKADVVYWPVSKYYDYLQEYIGSENIKFVNEESSFPYKETYTSDPHCIIDNKELLYIPLQRSDRIIPYNGYSNHPMYCKYELVGLSYTDWVNYVHISRNYHREKVLENYINAKNAFVLVNNTFGTYPDCFKNNNIPTTENCIYIENKKFDRPFDWMGLFERAESIHTVETSFCYILSFMKTQNVNVYPRNKITDFSYVKDLFPKDWKYINNI